jgi:hypothetical protein
LYGISVYMVLGWVYDPFRRYESRTKSLGWGLTPGQCYMYGGICLFIWNKCIYGYGVGQEPFRRYESRIKTLDCAAKMFRIYINTKKDMGWNQFVFSNLGLPKMGLDFAFSFECQHFITSDI